jgi:uncharacterized protein (DUF427 family)
MSLTFSHGPLAHRPTAAVNYAIEGPRHRILFEPHPHRLRAVLGGETVLDTTDGRLLHESGILPVLYVPIADLRQDLLEPTEHTTHCPFKGDASYWSVRVGDTLAENAVWHYPEPLPEAEWLKGYASIYWDAMDVWLDEEERVEGHLRDPYHLVEVRRSSRRVRVLLDDELIAESDAPAALFETGLPTRWYLPPTGVRHELLRPSETTTVCAYKGTASYFSIELGDRVIEDAVWSYPEPLEMALKAGGHLCFHHDELTVEVD